MSGCCGNLCNCRSFALAVPGNTIKTTNVVRKAVVFAGVGSVHDGEVTENMCFFRLEMLLGAHKGIKYEKGSGGPSEEGAERLPEEDDPSGGECARAVKFRKWDRRRQRTVTVARPLEVGAPVAASTSPALTVLGAKEMS